MYIPILRSRPAEIAAFTKLSKKNIFDNGNILPLLEIIQHYPSGRIPKKNRPLNEVYSKIMQNNFNMIIDLPTYVDLSSPRIHANYLQFLSPLINNYNNRIEIYNLLLKNRNFVPVVSYNPNIAYLSPIISRQEKLLRKNFSTLAFRIFHTVSSSIINELSKIILPNDYLLLDIDELNFDENNLKTLYENIIKLKENKHCKIILLNAPIPDSFANSMIPNDNPAKINNELLNNYNQLGFDGFGDFAGIKKDKLKDGGIGYIATLLYSKFINKYIGYSAYPSQNVNDFANVIIPSINMSEYYNRYSTKHKNNCPGCIDINNISKDSPGNRTTWKAISIEHYIYSISELLSNYNAEQLK